MFSLVIPGEELWDEEKEEFKTLKGQSLQLEHSLVSLSKWEATWNKAFLAKEEKSDEEVLDYIKCMTLTQSVPPEVYDRLTDRNIEEINAYIDKPMTATRFFDDGKRGGMRETITSELIYYWMISLGIPFECQKWHLNRLITLIKVCNAKNAPSKKHNRRETASRYSALNAARRKQLGSRG